MNDWLYELSNSSDNKLWKIAIGLEDVDGLKPSKYLIDLINKNLSINEIEKRITLYYENNNDDKEADIVSINIVKVLSIKSFRFDYNELISIHNDLFYNVFNYAGKIRDYNISKDEWILNGDSVTYASYNKILELLKYDFNEENNFSYDNLSINDVVKHLCKLVSNIWQIHPFGEGNTRSIAVFIIKYLNVLGFDINEDVFALHSWYFRNSLVRANYNDNDYSFLEKFFYNLLTNSDYDLQNIYTHIDYDKFNS